MGLETVAPPYEQSNGVNNIIEGVDVNSSSSDPDDVNLLRCVDVTSSIPVECSS